MILKDGEACYENEAEKRLYEAGYEDVVFFVNEGYDDALIGVTVDDRAVYDYDLMVKWLMVHDGIDVTEAIEWIEYNTIRAAQYMGERAPVIVRTLE